ncbi:MAG: DEAD/DEAH box helicase [Opitutae bacterium]|nr:DEAD/DEAH box helicase [Opitutae bacterium]
MLRKFIAKLREKISPASKAKKPVTGAAPSKSPTRERDQGPRPRGHHHPAGAAGAHPSGQGSGSGHGSGHGPRGRGRGRGGAGSHGASSHGSSHGPAHKERDRDSRGHGPAHRGGRDRAVEKPYEPPLSTHRDDVPLPDVPKMETAFSALGLGDALAFAVQEKGYTEPTPIQTQAIPLVLARRDVIGSAQTGTGKTAAFALPIIQNLGRHGRLRCLILEPTRELALQVEQAFVEYSKFTDLRVTIVYGGVGYGKQTDDLRRGMDILAATPGRLLDHLEQGNCSLNDIDVLVLDEVDRMLDMGFLPDVKRIVQKCPKQRQTLFFTATMPPEIEQLASWALHEPVRVEIGQRRSPAETVSHAFYPVVAEQKFDLLAALLERTQYNSVLIFSRTKIGADRIATRLKNENHRVGVLHADRNQRERIEALEGFKSGKYEVLVATDIAARGLDIQGITHVINYDVPENPEDYVHRIGRTGRATKTGEAFTLVTEETVRDARSIERFIGTTIERKRIENFPYTYSALFDVETLEAAAAAVAKPTSRLHGRVRRS